MRLVTHALFATGHGAYTEMSDTLLPCQLRDSCTRMAIRLPRKPIRRPLDRNLMAVNAQLPRLETIPCDA